MGRIAVRPRPYQFVPLIMALRLDPVRLLIADDVGIGKTIEAGMIARELLDRGDTERLCVLCPPHLCDWWQRELEEKFGITAAMVRSNTIARLERDVQPPGVSIYRYYPHLVVSIDFAKLAHRKHDLLAHAPELVIVDEAHGAARPGGYAGTAQQLRYELVRELASRPERHLLLVTATPHSGIEASFQSLLGLLNPQFEALDLPHLGDKDRERLARHLVQRTRGDVRKWMDEETRFPVRESSEVPYSLSPTYQELFEDVQAFTRELVRQPGLSQPRQRVRYWAALALLRCVISSPAAALRAFDTRLRKEQAADDEVDDDLRRRETLDPIEGEVSIDTEPEASIEVAVAEVGERAARRLRQFRRQAEAIMRSDHDFKIVEATKAVASLLRDGFRPIVYCRYVATASYVAAELETRLREEFKDLHAIALTGETGSDEEREARLGELSTHARRVLVATDCLSEGVNLQSLFDAVVHYDLPWNPNRLEQREGRVDRYGQPNKAVRAVLMFGTGNPIDAAVLRVLIRKARQIHRRLGISVPVPVDSETVVSAVIEALFEGKPVDEHPEQLSLELEGFANVTAMHEEWDRQGERERESRTRFAQHAIKPHEIARELAALDEVLGDPQAVRRFFVEASQRLGVRAERKNGAYVVDPLSLRETVRERLGWKKPTKILFDVGGGPDDHEAVVIGRTHPLIASMADQILEEAFRPDGTSRQYSRCGASYTNAVSRRTVVVLLRIRYRLAARRGPELFAEEIVTSGFWRSNGDLVWYNTNDGSLLDLLERANPVRNISQQERERQVGWALDAIATAAAQLDRIAKDRATQVDKSHAELRRYTGGGAVRAHAYIPPDILGVYVLVPGEKS
jgi:superfamily II DNA or RNA helicase